MATIKALGSLKNTIKYLSIQQKLAKGIWPWTDGIRSRLPDHYKLRYIALYQRDPEAVHYKPKLAKYELDEYGQRVDVMNVPLPVIYPEESNRGLWGGEGFLLGFKKKDDKHYKPKAYRLWKPMLSKRSIYSEILDQWLLITVTMRTLDLIDEAHGFDHYILGTHQMDLHSKLGMEMKKKLLLIILNKSMYPNDPDKCQLIYDKYKKYLIPEEEIEWLGLSMEEAERKQEDIEEEEYQANKKPLKEVYMKSLIDELKKAKADGTLQQTTGSSWLEKLSPFQKQ